MDEEIPFDDPPENPPLAQVKAISRISFGIS